MKKLLYILPLVLFISCLQEESINQGLTSISPKDINDGWVISNPESEGMGNEALNEIYQQIHRDEDLWSIRSLLVFRNNKLVTEAYFKDDNDITTKHLIWSSTKQVMGVLTGIAVDKGLIESIDDPISKYLPEANDYADKANITIRNLITMKSGIGFDNDGLGGQTDLILRQLPENILEFILELPMIAEPGTVFNYNDGDPQLMACIIQKITGKPTDEWADEVLFSKIGFNNYNWVRYKDNYTFGGFGLETTPRELSKFAMLVLNNGFHSNQQIVTRSWLENMLTVHATSNFGYDFGFFWWMVPNRKIYISWGHGGQLAFIIPEKDLLVVLTSIPNTQGEYQIHADEVMPYIDDIINCCE